MITLLAVLFAGVTITLSPEARVQGTELSLGAVATVQCDDAALAARVQALSLGYAPAPGFSRLLEAGVLLRQVRALAPGADVRFAGSGTCRVLPLTESVSAEALESAARASLAAHVAARGLADCALELQDTLGAVLVPKGRRACALEVAPLKDGSALSSVQVAVRIVVDGETYRTLYTRWSVRAWREQPVLVRGVRAGETIEASMFEMRRAPIDAALAANALEPAQVLGTAASRALESGRALQKEDLVRPLIVQKGDALILVVRSGSVQVRAPAIASQAGAAGDRIRVVVQSSGRELNALVESRDTARVDLGSRTPSGDPR